MVFGAAPAFEHGGLEQHTRNQPIPAAFAFRPLQQKLIKTGDINRRRLWKFIFSKSAKVILSVMKTTKINLMTTSSTRGSV